MKNFKKLFGILLTLMLILSVFCGCGDSKTKSKDENSKNEKASSTDSKLTPKEKDDSSVAETKPIEEDWSAFNFTIDGKAIKLPVKYDVFKQTGWEVDLSYIGHKNGYVLNSKSKTASTVDTFHSKYRTVDNKYDIYCGIGLINNDTAAQDITKCDVRVLSIKIEKALKNQIAYPKVVLSKGITWGASKEDIDKAFGKPKGATRAENLKYWSYTYQIENQGAMNLEIYDDIGLSSIYLIKYNK